MHAGGDTVGAGNCQVEDSVHPSPIGTSRGRADRDTRSTGPVDLPIRWVSADHTGRRGREIDRDVRRHPVTTAPGGTVTQLVSFLRACAEPGRFLPTPQEAWDVVSGHRGAGRLVTVNLFDLAHYVRDPAYRASLHRADWWCADGAPVAAAVQGAGITVHRTPGSDLVTRLTCPDQPGGPRRIAVLGSTETVSRRFADRVAAAGRQVVFADWGHRDDWTVARVGAGLRAAGPDVVLVAVGTPFHGAVTERLAGAVACPIVGVGAAVNMAVGVERRAPRLVRHAHGEWAWRLVVQPRRMWRRYLLDCLPLVGALHEATRIVAAEPVSARRGDTWRGDAAAFAARSPSTAVGG